MRFYSVVELQFTVEFQYVKVLVLGPLLSPSMGYRVLGDTEETAQEPTVRCNIQPVSHSAHRVQ